MEGRPRQLDQEVTVQMFRFMDHTRKVAVGAALAAFMVSQTALPGSVANAVFVDQITPVISETVQGAPLK